MKSRILLAQPVFLFLSVSPALAEDWASSPYLLGDWGGSRKALADQGYSFVVGYGGESAHNFSGGTKELTEYTDQWAFGASLDTEKAGFWKGGTARVMVTDRNGRNLGSDAGIGSDMLIQEVYGRGQTWHTTQFWFNQKFFDDQFEIKLGRMTVGEDFAGFSCDFQNLTFCGSQPGNIVGNYWVNWPTSQWAARLEYHQNKEWSWLIGAYQVNPTYVSDAYAIDHGLSLDNPSGSVGTLIPAEVQWRPIFNEHKGSYKIGAWYNTAQAPELNNNSVQSSQYGAYLNFEQQLTGSDVAPGLSVFLNISQADVETASVDRQISIGSQYHGPWGRRRDTVGLAVGATNNNSRVHESLYGDGNEYVGELYYSYAPIASLFLQPNVQDIVHPGGMTANSDAFIFGLKTGLTF
jgi:porin